jgi:hypothetical protein
VMKKAGSKPTVLPPGLSSTLILWFCKQAVLVQNPRKEPIQRRLTSQSNLQDCYAC